jgi:hypothetical protein
MFAVSMTYNEKMQGYGEAKLRELYTGAASFS